MYTNLMTYNYLRRLKKIKELIINIDMINGFVKKGTLAAPSIMRIVERQKELLDEIENNEEVGIVFIRDSHDVDAVEFKTYPPHCIKGTKETEVIDELKEYEKYALTYLKNSTNLMYALNMQQDLLRFYNLERVRYVY